MGMNSIEKGSTGSLDRDAQAHRGAGSGSGERCAGDGRRRTRRPWRTRRRSGGSTGSRRRRSGRRRHLRRHGARDSDGPVQHDSARSQDCAIRAATSFRPTRPISPRPRSSSTRCSRTASPSDRRDRGFHGGRQELPGRVVRREEPRRPSARTSSTCSSRRTIPTISLIPADRRSVPTTSPAGLWPCRWACSTIASWMASTGRSPRSTGCCRRPPGPSSGPRIRRAI